jgi:hypothetical protein
MTESTANVLQESMLLMKHTPSDIGRVTQKLFQADDRTLEALPVDTFQHYFDELGIILLNWTARGKTDDIDKILRSIAETVFSCPDMSRLPDLTIKQRVGLQLRVLCAQMTLYLQTQTATSYAVLLQGTRNATRRHVLQALYKQATRTNPMSTQDIIDWMARPPRTKRHSTYMMPPTRQKLQPHLQKLTNVGLAIEVREAGSVRYYLSDRGKVEAEAIFGPLNPSQPQKEKHPKAASISKPTARTHSLGVSENHYEVAL